MKCPICKATMFGESMVFIVELEDGRELRLEDVPTWVCQNCDHTEVEPEVIEAVEDMLDHLDTVAGDSDAEEG